LPWLLSG